MHTILSSRFSLYKFNLWTSESGADERYFWGCLHFEVTPLTIAGLIIRKMYVL
jgi:hypothetical protein